VTLLATEAVLRVLLLALVEVLAASTTTTAAVGLVVISGGGDVEEVFLVGSCDVGSLSLCMFVSILPVKYSYTVQVILTPLEGLDLLNSVLLLLGALLELRDLNLLSELL